MKRRILCDVDLTIIDPAFGREGYDWFSWLREHSVGFANNKNLYEDMENKSLEYKLGTYFELGQGVDSMDFWRKDIYDDLEPYHDAVDVLNELLELGHEVVFVSHCKALHYRSKVAMCKKYFSKMTGFIATKEKGLVTRASDIMVDDRHSFLNQSGALQNVKMNTVYTQEESLDKPVCVVNTWYEFKETFKEELF